MTYTQRILAHVDGLDPLGVLTATADRLDGLIGDVPRAVLLERPEPGRWSINDILAHLADGEIVVGYRLRAVLGAPGSPIIAFDQDRWETAGHYDRRDSHMSARQFRAVRDANLALLTLLDAAQWTHAGVHSERGEESIEHMVRMAAGHDINHVRQIEQILTGRTL
jgi:hypothetical protein